MARGSGDSVDRASKLQSLADVKKRGLWIQDSSLRRYEKEGQLNASWQTLTGRQQAHFATEHSIARCLFDRQGASLAFDALKSSQVRTGRHRTRCHVQHGFSSLQSGAKHHVLNTSDVTRLPRFPKRLVHVLASEFIKGSPFCLNPASLMCVPLKDSWAKNG